MCNPPLNLYHFLPYDFNINWFNSKVSFTSNPNTVPLLIQIIQAKNQTKHHLNYLITTNPHICPRLEFSQKAQN